MFEGKERRKSARRKKDVIIKFFIVDRGNETGHGITANISESGMAIYTASAVNNGESLLFDRNPFIPFEIAVARWTKKVNGVCQAGLERILLQHL